MINKILIADDMLVNRKPINIILRKNFKDIIICMEENGSKALNKIKSSKEIALPLKIKNAIKSYEQRKLLRETQEQLIISLANVIEMKNKDIDGHSRRVAKLAILIGEKLGLKENILNNLEISGIIHDIGKVGVPDNILNKVGALRDDEIEILKQHTIMGEAICKPLKILEKCLDVIRHHHEKLNGSGYPDGLRGDEISIEVRIVQVADIFDALYSKRPYKDKLALIEVKEIIRWEVAEGLIDKEIVEVLYKILDSNEEREIYS